MILPVVNHSTGRLAPSVFVFGGLENQGFAGCREEQESARAVGSEAISNRQILDAKVGTMEIFDLVKYN